MDFSRNARPSRFSNYRSGHSYRVWRVGESPENRARVNQRCTAQTKRSAIRAHRAGREFAAVMTQTGVLPEQGVFSAYSIN
jgi:hypothetical protein